MTRAESSAKTFGFDPGGGGKGVVHLYPDGGASRITGVSDRDVPVHYRGSGTRSPFILILPMTGDPGYLVSRRLCAYLSEHSFRCGYLERSLPEPVDMPRTIEETLKLDSLPPRSALAARRALDELEKTGELARGEKIGIGGISLGAIDAAIVALTDERVSAAALFLGGGDMAHMLTKINGLGVKDFVLLRGRQMAAKGWTMEEFPLKIEQYTLDSDPLTYAAAPKNALPADRFLMINVAGDSAVPNRCSDELAAALSKGGAKPDYEMLSLWYLPKTWRHIGALLRLHHAERRMLQHFQKFLVR